MTMYLVAHETQEGNTDTEIPNYRWYGIRHGDMKENRAKEDDIEQSRRCETCNTSSQIYKFK